MLFQHITLSTAIQKQQSQQSAHSSISIIEWMNTKEIQAIELFQNKKKRDSGRLPNTANSRNPFISRLFQLLFTCSVTEELPSRHAPRHHYGCQPYAETYPKFRPYAETFLQNGCCKKHINAVFPTRQTPFPATIFPLQQHSHKQSDLQCADTKKPWASAIQSFVRYKPMDQLSS